MDFELAGRPFTAINGKSGPLSFALFSLVDQYFMAMDSTDELRVFTEAISSIILCKNQEEVDYYWDQFLEGGDGFYRQASAWIRDKYGLWWQPIHLELSDMMRADQKSVKSVIEEMNKSEKIDVGKIKRELNWHHKLYQGWLNHTIANDIEGVLIVKVQEVLSVKYKGFNSCTCCGRFVTFSMMTLSYLYNCSF